jgi:Ca2+-binding EF-hand superfamily protein
MLLAFGAASAAVDAIKSLTSKPSSSQPIGFGPAPGSPFDISAPPSGGSTAVPGFSGGAQISPVTLSALLAAQSQSSSTAGAAPAATNPGSALKDLFSQIDANGDGQITKSEFESALGAGGTNVAAADKVFNELDSNGDGSVSLGELKSALKGGHHGGHHHVHATSSTGSTDADGSTTNGNTNGSVSSDPLLQALAASSATTTSSTSKNGGTGLSSLLTPVDSSQLTPISLSAASYARLEQLIHNGPQFSTSTTPLSLSA